MKSESLPVSPFNRFNSFNYKACSENLLHKTLFSPFLKSLLHHLFLLVPEDQSGRLGGFSSVERNISSMAEFGVYSCYNCRNNVSLHDDIVSKTFQASNGRGFLFSHAMNIVLGPKVDKQLISGLHSVADVYCCDCRTVLGWKYERAYVPTQKYKEGKFVLEKVKIVKENW